MIKISIDSRELSKFINNLDKYSLTKQEQIKKEITRASYSIQAKAKQESPVKKGFLRNSIDVIIKNNGVTGQVIVKRDYGIFVHEGTKPHTIEPRNKKVLAWKADKRYIFSKRVFHPGTKANPFLLRAVEKERPTYQQNLTNIFK